MKAGDLVRHRSNYAKKSLSDESVGLVVGIVQKKVARLTAENKPVVKWDIIKPEPHAVVIWGNNGKSTVPVTDLEVTIESD